MKFWAYILQTMNYQLKTLSQILPSNGTFKLDPALAFHVVPGRRNFAMPPMSALARTGGTSSSWMQRIVEAKRLSG